MFRTRKSWILKFCKGINEMVMEMARIYDTIFRPKIMDLNDI